ncbi:MAG: HAD-IC family P-type ATPase, partial [Christensenellales bacterium]
ESVPIRKNIGDNILAGSHIVAGEARCRADRVGKDCYIEKILRIASKFNKPKSMIFNTLNFIIKCLSVVLVILGVFIFLSERLTMTGEWRDLIITVASSILGMLPVGMFMLTSTALAGSVLKLSKTGALPQDIYAIEMLAQVDTLLLDKTGTLTDGQMKVVDVKILDPQVDVDSVMASINYWTRDNKPTARALVDYFGGNFDNASQDGDEASQRLSRVLDCDEVRSFSSLRKCSAIKIGENCYFLGAPDYVAVPSQETEKYCHDNACVGKRTIMLSTAKGDIDSLDKTKATPIALFALEDRLRENVKDTLDWFACNDVDIKIISGDNPETVSYIASKAGVRNADKYLNCSTADDLTVDVVKDTVVFGRVSPSQKEDIVKALQDSGRVVGMIGDGVNDIQALKESDCSISFLGAHEVARNISRIVLLNDDFASMPSIVREGRRVINNMEKVSSLYIMKTLFIMVMTFVFSIITLATHTPSYPFDTKKIMIVELFVIGLPTYIYAFQPNDARISGRFMHNIIKSSISALVGLCVAVFVMYALNFRIDFGGVENVQNYRNSLLTVALIAASFGAMFIISAPLNKLRACVIATMIILTVASVYIDSHYLGNLFFGLEVVQWRHIPYALASGLVGFAVHLALYWIVEAMDKKWGQAINDKMKRLVRTIKTKMKRSNGNAHQS